MGFEDTYKRQSDRVEHKPNPEHPVILRMYPKAENVMSESAIDPATFTDLYGTENVTRDLRKVEALKSTHEHSEGESAAKVLEAILLQHTELSDWLGPNAETIRTSEFDDLINGVDLVLEFNEKHSAQHLALGVDVTFGSLTLQRKFDRIKKEIENDDLARVKYFEAHGYKGSLLQLPRVVIGVELHKVIQLAGLWEREDNKALENHITKDIIAKEIERQLGTYLIYARSIHAEKAVKSYTRALATMRNVRTVRNGFSEDLTRQRMVEEDRVYQSITENLSRFRVTSPRR